nr:zinc finger, RING/FYVE/PHD-type [Tanacetum cinerariifolium]
MNGATSSKKGNGDHLSNKGRGNSDDINLVTLTNSYVALNEEDKVFVNMDNSNAGNDGNTVKEATKVVEDGDNDVEDVYNETTQFMASSSKRDDGVKKRDDLKERFTKTKHLKYVFLPKGGVHQQKE